MYNLGYGCVKQNVPSVLLTQAGMLFIVAILIIIHEVRNANSTNDARRRSCGGD